MGDPACDQLNFIISLAALLYPESSYPGMLYALTPPIFSVGGLPAYWRRGSNIPPCLTGTATPLPLISVPGMAVIEI